MTGPSEKWVLDGVVMSTDNSCARAYVKVFPTGTVFSVPYTAFITRSLPVVNERVRATLRKVDGVLRCVSVFDNEGKPGTDPSVDLSIVLKYMRRDLRSFFRNRQPRKSIVIPELEIEVRKFCVDQIRQYVAAIRILENHGKT